MDDTSNADFSLVPVPQIMILAPAGGEEWKYGTEHEVSWQMNQLQFAEEVILEYSTDDFVEDINTVEQVSSGTAQGTDPNDDIIGTYDWTVPDAVSGNMRVRVKEASAPAGRDTQTAVSAISNVILVTEPTIAVTRPVIEQIFVAGDTEDITWDTDGAVSDDLLFQYSVDEGSTWTDINPGGGEANDGSYSWAIPQEAVGETVLVKITDNSRTQVTGQSDAFEVLSYATYEVTIPNGGEDLTIGTEYDITWTSYGKKIGSGGEDYFFTGIYYSTDNGDNWTLVAEQQANDGSYTWDVPDVETAEGLIKIVDANDELIVDTSDTTFSITLPTVTLSTPNGGEIWFATGVYNITWTSVGTISDNVTLEYSSNGGSTWTGITAGLPNSPSDYSWTVADVSSANAKIKVYDGNRSDVSDVSDEVFSIQPPEFIVNFPNGGEEWAVGTTHEINWSSTGYDYGAVRDNVTIRYSSDNGDTWEDVSTLEENDGSYFWLIPDDVSAQCLLKVLDATRPATTDTSDAAFTICLPYVNITAPNGGEQWPIGTIKQVTWESVGSISDNLKLEYSKDNFATTFQIDFPVANTGTFDWTIPDDYSTTAKLRITDMDRAEITDDSDGTFSISNPTVRITAPNGGELWTVGDTEVITWINNGSVGGSLKAEYSKDNFASDLHTIDADVTNSGDTGTLDWTLPDDTSTTVRVRITDNTRPVVWDKADADFTILPIPVITITSPIENDSWRVGTEQEITWEDNGGLISNNLTLRYSTDAGGSWPEDKIIAAGEANDGSYTWTVPDDESDTCMIKITDASRPSTNSLSPVFKIKPPSVTIISPNGGETWAIADRAPVTWTSEGSVSDNLILEYSIDGADGTYFLVEASVANTGSYTWVVPDTLSSNAFFRIKDGNRLATFDVSDEAFIINPSPTITITTPNGGEEWVMGEDRDITWIWTGLSISDNLIIEASNDDFLTTRQVIAQEVPNTGSYTWTISDDSLTGSTLKIRITDGDRTIITDKTDGYFRIRGGFTLLVPNGNESWTALAGHTVSWQTRGNIPKIKMDYSVDDGLNWITVAAAADNIGSYTWTLPNAQAAEVLVRMSDPTDPTVTDQSDSPFSIVYQTVQFKLLDFDTLQHLNDFAVSEPSTGWNDTGLESPIMRTLTYPYGSYTSFFTKTNYIDNSVTWSPPKTGAETYVVTVYLENSASAQVTWEAILTYSFSPANDNLSAVGSLQRKGKLVGTRDVERAMMGRATLRIYKPDGETIKHELFAAVPSNTGMYNFALSPTAFESGYVYPATLSIEYRGQDYTSAASIDVGSEILQYEFFTQTAANLAASVAAIEVAVAGGTQAMMDHMDEVEEVIRDDTAQILTAATTTLPAAVEASRRVTERMLKSEILNRQNIVKKGATVKMRYRTMSGLQTVALDLYNPKGLQKINKLKMTEIGTTGVYEVDVEFKKAWGTGDFSIICSDSTYGTMDGVVMTALKSDIESIATDASSAAAVGSSLGSLDDTIDSLDSQFATLEGSLAQMAKGIVSDVEGALDTVSYIEELYAKLNTMSASIKKVQDTTMGMENLNVDKFYEIADDKKNDVKYIKNKTQQLQAMMELNQKMMDNVANEPVVQTWYEYRSVVIKALILNPSTSQERSVPFKAYLPKEAKPEHVLSRGDLSIAYDTQQGSYYVHNTYNLKPKESREVEIEMKDIWQVRTTEIESLRLEAKKVYKMLKETEFSDRAKYLLASIESNVDKVIDRQKVKPSNPEVHISNYRENLNLITDAKADLSLARSLLSQVKPIPIEITWKLIMAIIGFLGILSFGFYIIWQKQINLAETPSFGGKEKK